MDCEPRCGDIAGRQGSGCLRGVAPYEFVMPFDGTVSGAGSSHGEAVAISRGTPSVSLLLCHYVPTHVNTRKHVKRKRERREARPKDQSLKFEVTLETNGTGDGRKHFGKITAGFHGTPVMFLLPGAECVGGKIEETTVSVKKLAWLNHSTKKGFVCVLC